jgi:hypothetical protein
MSEPLTPPPPPPPIPPAPPSYAPPPSYGGPPPAGGGGGGGTSGKATTSLVLGILGILCCGLLAPVAWIMGKGELDAIRRGQSSPAGEGVAKAGYILGIIGTILFVFAILWVFLWGGLAFLSALAEAGG